MRRIPLLLAVVVGVLTVGSGSALATAVRQAASPPVSSSLPTIGGTAREGQTLTAGNGTWSGITPITYAYQWQRCNSAGSGCASIGKATSQNYVVSKGDVAKTIRVEVTATNADGKAQALSAATSQVAVTGNAPASTKQADPSGTAQVGLTVKVDDGKWSGDKPITFTYQWQSCVVANGVCTNLAGATSSSFLIGTTQLGTQLRATITATNAAGKTSATSNLTTAVLAKLGAPVIVGLPAISGTATVGQRLQASTGTWTGTTTTTPFGYQWSRCNSTGSACANISGATGQSYGVGQADRGMALRVSVTATNANGSTTVRSSALAIRAAVVETSKYSSVLRAGQEVTRPKGVSSQAAGHFTAKVTGKTLTWTLTFSHLTSRPTVTGLHKGARGSNGVAFKTLCRQCYSGARGTLTLTSSQLDALKRGLAYVNIHTKRNPSGEIRGQIARVS